MICVSPGGLSLPTIVVKVATRKLPGTSGWWLATALDAEATAHHASLIGTKAVSLEHQVFPVLSTATSIVWCGLLVFHVTLVHLSSLRSYPLFFLQCVVRSLMGWCPAPPPPLPPV